MHPEVATPDDMPTLDLVDSVQAAGHFSVLCNAIKATGLVEALREQGPFTLFAPTDAAFRKLSRDTINALLKDKGRLMPILTYHVLRGKTMAQSVQSGELETIQGESLRVVVSDDDGVRINNARVMKWDIEASNGVIHSIDTLLMPA